MDSPSLHFIEQIVVDDRAAGKHDGRVVTRFPPEPNGYLHIGHAKSICLNFGLAAGFGGVCHLRMDDTNPLTESEEFEQNIQEDVRWLGFDWGNRYFRCSDYYEQLYVWAEALIVAGKAYVDDLSADQVSEYRGTFTVPGRDSPYRARSVDENLDLFRRMRAGEFADGARTLRAKIDMANANPNLRDPAIYRIRRTQHHAAGNWVIYPLYDYAHPLSDAIEGITHSICTLEFENRRPLYDWVLDAVAATPGGLKPTHVPAGILARVAPASRPQQIEFARLKLTYTVMSKRMLLQLVREGTVSGWDDPRMPTVRAFRRRGYTPSAIRTFATAVGVSKADSLIDVGVLENTIRDELNRDAPRAMAVLRPLKLVIENWPDGHVEHLDVPNHPQRPELGTRQVSFGREIFIEQEDFMEDPPKKFFRLGPGREVRLRSAYFVTCREVVKDASGAVTELRCTYDPATKGGDAPDGRKVKGTLHWVSAAHALRCTARLYDRLFTVPTPDREGGDFKTYLNPASLEVLDDCRVEPLLAGAEPGARFQFERLGYFYVDPKDSTPGKPVFNRTVTLKDSWAKMSD